MFGSHLSIAGGLETALLEAERLGLETVQVFTKNQRQWKVSPLDESARLAWLEELGRLGWGGRVVAHDSYLTNLASPDAELWEKSIALMRQEIERCAALSISLLVSHPGAHMLKEGPWSDAQRIEAGLVRIARAYKRLFRDTRGAPVTICLENTAGGGTTLGRRFDELARLRALILLEAQGDADLEGPGQSGRGGRVGFCLDTCHALAAGYDIASTESGDSTGLKRSLAEGRTLGAAALAEFDRVCGLEHLRVVHLNDSLGGRGSRIDRHAHIGKGKVALGAFAAVVNEPALAACPMILETPKEDSARGEPMDRVNLKKLRGLLDTAPEPLKRLGVPGQAAPPPERSATPSKKPKGARRPTT